MNFLAHLYLSGPNEKIQVGNFIGDFVKGNQIINYESEIQLGIRLHREIDFFTDSHPIVLSSKKRLRAKFRHYAPVIVDVFYDHFLAKKWALFSSVSLATCTLDFYERVTKYSKVIPKTANNVLVYMRQKNWLYHYQFLDGIDCALTGMSMRTKFHSKMEQAVQSLKKHYASFETEFDWFFPDIREYAKKFLDEKSSTPNISGF